jgi:hypothetical protein
MEARWLQREEMGAMRRKKQELPQRHRGTERNVLRRECKCFPVNEYGMDER